VLNVKGGTLTTAVELKLAAMRDLDEDEMINVPEGLGSRRYNKTYPHDKISRI
jgi:hypothetical protein